MSEEKETKKERKVKVFTKKSIWLDGPDGKPAKTPAKTTVLLTADQVKHFGDAVTKDIPEEA